MSIPPAVVFENFFLFGKCNFLGQISWHIFVPKRGFCLFNLCIFANYFSEYAGHAGEMILSMNLLDVDGIVICSGDGLVYEVCLFNHSSMISWLSKYFSKSTPY